MTSERTHSLALGGMALWLALAAVGCRDLPRGALGSGLRPDGMPLGLSLDLGFTDQHVISCTLYCDDGDWGPLHSVSGPFTAAGGAASAQMEAKLDKHQAELLLRSPDLNPLTDFALVVRRRDSRRRNALLEVAFHLSQGRATPEVSFTYLTEGNDEYVRLLEPYRGRLSGFRRTWEEIRAHPRRARFAEPLGEVSLQGTIVLVADGDIGFDDFPTAIYPVEPAELTTVVFVSTESKTHRYKRVNAKTGEEVYRFKSRDSMIQLDIVNIARTPCQLELSWEYHRHTNDDLAIRDLLLRAYGTR